MKLVNIKISRYPNPVSGIKLYENNNIIIILYNPVDYVLDGINIINKKYIKIIEEEKEDVLKLDILNYKVGLRNYFLEYDNFTEIHDIIKYFYVQKSKLIEIGLESSSYSLIGNILKLNEKSFILNLLSTKAKFIKEERIDYDKIRILSFNNDYLNAFEYYLENIK
ncbi:MAG: hypothetical protein L6262_01215 [Weeksellaceae bacterium]|nr:hypothetical protein [Weeksellaceae bacterium]